MNQVVAKFGGSSMANPERVAEVVISHPEQRYIVVSAPGASAGNDLKLTEELIEYATLSDKSSPKAKVFQEKVLDRFDQIYSMLPPSQLAELRDVSYKNLNVENQTPEYIATLGEVFSAQYFTRLIGAVALDSPIWFYNNELNRQATREEIRRRHGSVAHLHKPIVVPGFFGYDHNKAVRTLGRGGSDRTAVLIATALGFDHQNWTDVDGVYSANPKAIKRAYSLEEITRAEVREGAHGGNGVFQGDAIVDMEDTKIGIQVLNTFNPCARGTSIVERREINPEQPLIATSSRDLLVFDTVDLGMANKPGYLARILSLAESLGISIEHAPAAHDAVMLTCSENVDRNQLETLREEAEKRLISTNGQVTIGEKAVVYAIGEALKDEVVAMKVEAKVISLLLGRGLSYKAIVSHAHSPSLAYLVDKDQRLPVEQAIYDGFLR